MLSSVTESMMARSGVNVSFSMAAFLMRLITNVRGAFRRWQNALMRHSCWYRNSTCGSTSRSITPPCWSSYRMRSLRCVCHASNTVEKTDAFSATPPSANTFSDRMSVFSRNSGLFPFRSSSTDFVIRARTGFGNTSSAMRPPRMSASITDSDRFAGQLNSHWGSSR